ncbi:NUDIX hydrolase [bacterium]|nr:NUDIX hydrolase [bacterium]
MGMERDAELEEILLASEHIFRGKILRVVVDTVRLPDGREATREVIHHNGAVGMVPLTDDGQVLLVRQWRHATGRALLEIPAGALAHGEEPDACACRELAEETGCVARRLDVLTVLYTAPGYVGEAITIYLARDLHPQDAMGDDDENVQVVPLPFEEAVARCLGGEICDGKTIAALLLAREFLAAEP